MNNKKNTWQQTVVREPHVTGEIAMKNILYQNQRKGNEE
jgi:hypothetical protein